MQSGITRRGFVRSGVAGAAVLPFVGSAQAQAWPSKTVRVICGYPPGGATDLIARAYAEFFSRLTNQQFIVDNKSGASGTVGALELKRSAPDGYTLMMTISTTLLQNRVLFRNLAYEADKDFILVAAIQSAGTVTVVDPAIGVTNLKEFVEYARKTEKVSFGTFAAGSTAHLVAAELNNEYGLKIEPVHYRGEAPMFTDLAGRSIQVALGSYNGARKLIESGRGRAIAVTGRKRLKELPDVSTYQEQGAKSLAFQLVGYACLVAPAGTPLDIVQRLSALVVAGGKDAKILATMTGLGYYDPPLDLQATQKQYQEEGPAWIALTQGLGLTPE